jgi:predicted RND superfamily exporter protein
MNNEITPEEYNNKFNVYMFFSLVSLVIALFLDFKYNNRLYILFYLLPSILYILDEVKSYKIKSYWRNK